MKDTRHWPVTSIHSHTGDCPLTCTHTHHTHATHTLEIWLENFFSDSNSVDSCIQKDSEFSGVEIQIGFLWEMIYQGLSTLFSDWCGWAQNPVDGVTLLRAGPWVCNKASWASLGRKPVSSVPSWLLLQSLPLGFCCGFPWWRSVTCKPNKDFIPQVASGHVLYHSSVRQTEIPFRSSLSHIYLCLSQSSSPQPAGHDSFRGHMSAILHLIYLYLYYY